MRAGDIDIIRLAELLHSVPSGCDVTSITFEEKNLYRLHLVADTKIIEELHYEESLQNLREIIRQYDKKALKSSDRGHNKLTSE